PGVDFFKYAAGTWLKRNPIPADKSRWSGFEQLRERNLYLLRGILEDAATDRQAAARTPRRQVGAVFAAGLDTNRLEKRSFKALAKDLKKVDRLKSSTELVALLAEFHEQDINAIFGAGVSPDARQSSIYAFELGQGGLGLPDRDYYLKDTFAKQ